MSLRDSLNHENVLIFGAGIPNDEGVGRISNIQQGMSKGEGVGGVAFSGSAPRTPRRGRPCLARGKGVAQRRTQPLVAF